MKRIVQVEWIFRRELWALLLWAVTLGAGHSSAVADVPPLTSLEQQRLDTAVDGHARYDEAFAALVEHVRTWPEAKDIELETLPLRRKVDWELFSEDPSQLRGELVEISGQCVLVMKLEPTIAGDHIYELFIDTNQGTLIAYVSAPEKSPVRKSYVRVLGRLYTVKTMPSRDSVVRSWPAMVGILLPSSGVRSDLPGRIIVALIVIGMLVWLFLRRSAKKGFQGDTAQALAALRRDADEGEGESPDLPQDPAEALKELTKDHMASEDHDA